MARLYEFADLLRHHGRQQKMGDDQVLGRRGEDIAQRFLQRSGIIVVDRNYSMASGAGELDLVGWEGDTLVFVEVKARATDVHGAPDRAIGPQKERNLVRAAREYARHAEVPWQKVRFDVVSIVLSTPPAISHYRDVFGPSVA
ncbi:MAG TPA: YraN family protein [Bryobacteraceae bacterium]|nr:YraN family protein [Bryobacteraceae bacterium]